MKPPSAAAPHSGLVLVLVLVPVLVPTCSRSSAPVKEPARPQDAATITVRPPDAAHPIAVAHAAPAAPTESAEGDEPLQTEERERNPRSETVKLKLVISPAVRATVHWGRKRLAETRPGEMTVDLERPRGSGPIDLVVRADGYLPHHVRLFTDRNDRLSVRLTRPEEARGLLGYKPPATP
jgi:hypothetical protein